MRISRRRAMARAMSSPATLAQAIRKMMPTTVISSAAMTVNTLQMGEPESPPPRNTVRGSRGSHAGLEARGGNQPSRAAVSLGVAMKIWSDPNVGAPRSQPAVKGRRRHAGDGESSAIDPDGLAGNSGIAEESVAPEPVTDNG